MVAVVGETLIEDPVPRLLPVPFAPEYQRMLDPVPAVPPLAVRVTVELGHCLLETLAIVGRLELVLTVTVAGAPKPTVRTQPLLSVMELKV